MLTRGISATAPTSSRQTRRSSTSSRTPAHVDLYDKTDLIPFDKLAEFFTENLAGKPDLAIAGASPDG
jgi:hypothetical protein